MLVIGLSATDPNPAVAAFNFSTESDCRGIASVIEQKSSAAGSKLYAKCSETIPVTIGPDGSMVTEHAPAKPYEN